MRPKIVLLIILCLALGAGYADAGNSAAQSVIAATATDETVVGLPLHIQKLGPQTIRVWIGDHISSTAIVAFATEEGLVIIDTTGDPVVDRELRRIIARELGRDDFKILINTHEHWDHTGGNSVYADCTIVGHELVEAGMASNAGNKERIVEWYTNRIAQLEQEIGQLAADAPEKGRLQEDLTFKRLLLKAAEADTPLVPPTKTFANRLDLDLGDTTFELYYIGGMHSSSDIAIFVPERGLLMTGDTMADVWLTDSAGCLASFIARPNVRHDFPLLLENWNALLARKESIRKLIPGHWNGELTYEGFEARVQYVEALWEGTNEAVAAGTGLDEMLTGFDLATRFPELAESPGCSQGNNTTTITEMWMIQTDMESAAQVLYDLLDEGAEEFAIRNVVAHRGAESPSYFFLEAQINVNGYRFLQGERTEQAKTMFEINVELFPESWNTYDSLGEALLTDGDTDAAIAMYEKSLVLNPENTNGTQVLERIRSGAAVN